MRQILYVSKSTSRADQSALDVILQQSRHNNALDGITGLLWSDGDRFAQVMEGDERAVEEAMDRIRSDRRHRDIVVLQDHDVAERQFGDWSMELCDRDEVADPYNVKLRRALDGASDTVRTVFASLVSPVAA